MGRQLQLFETPKLVSDELKDLIHGSYELSVEIAKSQNINKFAFFVEAIKHKVSNLNLEEWEDKLGEEYITLVVFELYGFEICVYEYQATTFVLEISRGPRCLQSFDFHTRGIDEQYSQTMLKKPLIKMVYENSVTINNFINMPH